MDTLRGHFEDRDGFAADPYDYDPIDDDAGPETPPPSIGTDERRMQVRAYNHWASLLEDRSYPAIEDLEPENLPDFGPNSVLLDFTAGLENPGIAYLGEKLAEECDAGAEIQTLDDVPSRSLLSRITDHYLQILANQAPIGFEAEFVNQRGRTILYRGILLPFSSDDDTIDFIYGVINWKEMADRQTTAELLNEVDQALGNGTAPDPAEEDELPPARSEDDPIADWADGPATPMAPAEEDADESLETAQDEEISWDENDWPTPTPADPDEDKDEPLDLGRFDALLSLGDDEEDDDWDSLDGEDKPGFAPLNIDPAGVDADRPRKQPILSLSDEEVDETPLELSDEAADTGASADADGADSSTSLPEEGGSLWDWLASARSMAETALAKEDRSRGALYDAIGVAYDFALEAASEPEQFDEILADAGLERQERAPLTPLVKLVFGANYDKTRIAEYSTALAHGQRLGLGHGDMAKHLKTCEGGLKGVVQTERRLRKEESGKSTAPRTEMRKTIARKLRKREPMLWESLPAEGEEFALVMVRRTEEGEVVMLGEVPHELGFVERAAKKLLD